MSARAAETVVDILDLQDEKTAKAVARAIGEELRRAREALGWSRGYLVSRLPSGIGARTLLSYEHGTRHFTMLRFIELCHALNVSTPGLLALALQRARISLSNFALCVDLRALLADHTPEFRSLIVWAHNKLIECPGGVVEIAPAAVRELATMIGCPHHDLADYFARFTPDAEQITENENVRSFAATLHA